MRDARALRGAIMSALTRYFFTPVYSTRSASTIVRWWESRRLVYNAAVGGAGLTTLAYVTAVELLPPNSEFHGFPWGGVLVYAVLANLFYTFGPAIDVFIRKRWGDEYHAVGPALFRYGFVFAVGLTLLPIPLVTISKVIRVVLSLF
jgi:hypothetical protein